MAPMAKTGTEALGSMGTDTPLAVLSDKAQPLFNYFKQLFAQVTNPPVDCIREEIIMSTETAIGSEHNLLKPGPEHARLIELKSPILTNEEFAKLKHVDMPGFKSATLPILFKVSDGPAGLEKAMDDLCRKVTQTIQDGFNVVVLSDRGVNREWAPIPSLLAVSGVHHHLIREGTRTRVGLVLESGEPREVHHFAVLIGYGCGAVNPYLAFETLDDVRRQGLLPGMDHKTACKNYLKAAVKGVVKVISKMGISTIQSYWGAQIFEAVGLKQSFIDKYFTWTGEWASKSSPRKSWSVTNAPFQRAPSTATSWTPVANTNGAKTVNITSSTRRLFTNCNKPFAPTITRSSKSTRRWSTTKLATGVRCAASWISNPRLPSPSRKSSRSRASSGASNPAP